MSKSVYERSHFVENNWSPVFAGLHLKKQSKHEKSPSHAHSRNGCRTKWMHSRAWCLSGFPLQAVCHLPLFSECCPFLEGRKILHFVQISQWRDPFLHRESPRAFSTEAWEDSPPLTVSVPNMKCSEQHCSSRGDLSNYRLTFLVVFLSFLTASLCPLFFVWVAFIKLLWSPEALLLGDVVKFLLAVVCLWLLMWFLCVFGCLLFLRRQQDHHGAISGILMLRDSAVS